MFVQVIEGRVADRDRLRQQFERWGDELMAGADGFLGGTSGVADDGAFVALARFESEEHARRNNDRPEQDAWWRETETSFEGDVSFAESSDVELVGGGGSDDAGFVQVVQARITDRARLQAAEQDLFPTLVDARPEILGMVRVWHGDDRMSQFVYFSSEQEARAGEAAGPPAELAERMREFSELWEDVRYVDLRQPYLLTR